MHMRGKTICEFTVKTAASPGPGSSRCAASRWRPERFYFSVQDGVSLAVPSGRHKTAEAAQQQNQENHALTEIYCQSKVESYLADAHLGLRVRFQIIRNLETVHD